MADVASTAPQQEKPTPSLRASKARSFKGTAKSILRFNDFTSSASKELIESLNLAVGDSVFGHDEPALPAAAAAAAAAGASAAESSGRLEAERERVEKYKEAVFTGLPGGVVKSLKSSFQIMDGDGNNELDFGEFCHAMRLKQTTLARKLFQMYDRSGDGQIQMHEFIAEITKRCEPKLTVRRKMANMAADSTGNVHRDEIVSILAASHEYKDKQPKRAALERAAADMMSKIRAADTTQGMRLCGVRFATGAVAAEEDGAELYVTKKQFMRMLSTYEALIFPLNSLMVAEEKMAKSLGFALFKPLTANGPQQTAKGAPVSNAMFTASSREMSRIVSKPTT